MVKNISGTYFKYTLSETKYNFLVSDYHTLFYLDSYRDKLYNEYWLKNITQLQLQFNV